MLQTLYSNYWKYIDNAELQHSRSKNELTCKKEVAKIMSMESLNLIGYTMVTLSAWEKNKCELWNRMILKFAVKVGLWIHTCGMRKKDSFGLWTSATMESISGATVLIARCFKIILNGAPRTTSLTEEIFRNTSCLFAIKSTDRTLWE